MAGLRKFILLMLLSVVFADSAYAFHNRFCFIRSFPVSFGNYTPATPVPVDSTGRIRVLCIGGATGSFYTLNIDSGSSGNTANRTMQFGGNQLVYNLYKDPARTQLWGDGTGGATPLVQPVNSFFIVRNVRVYGRLFANQDPVPGVYSDTVFVTIEF